MSGRVDGSVAGDKAPSQAAEHAPPPQSPLSFRQVAMRCAVAAAFGLNISGPADLYVAGKSLRNYFRDAGRVPYPQVALDSTVYVCYGVLLAYGFYSLIHRMTSTANGARSPIQKSRTLRYASVVLCGFFANRDELKQAAASVVKYTAEDCVTLSRALYQVCRTLFYIFQMGLVYYKLISKAFEPPRQRAAPKRTHGDTQQPDIQLA